MEPGGRHPGSAVARDAMGLRQPGERDAGHIRRDLRGGEVLESGIDDAVVDLIGEQEEPMSSRELGDLLEHLAPVDRTGRLFGLMTTIAAVCGPISASIAAISGIQPSDSTQG